MAENAWPPLTGTGTRCVADDESPSSPAASLPQHQASPPEVRPQECDMPDASAAKRTLPTGVAGVTSRVLPSVPSCPRSLPPQQNARPSSASRQLWPPPTATRTRCDGGADTGTDTA